ncbi:hypothetical protein EMPS_03902 [Entomortierella parvispora]|uniref:Integrase catalytic domain-containing protein n=1 Tax=Entomortierella parvispora TaxID=205924 RepID=A0A9P3H8A2_9FUNG|nr:hypothetical protein EMPS_03902 [Entomortierella parvispora]
MQDRFVYWPHFTNDTQLYVPTCEKCQRNKGSQERPAGLSNPSPLLLSVLGRRHHGLHPPSFPHNLTTLTPSVFVDKLTKLAHFVPSTTSATAIDVAHQFFDNIFKLHGLPTSIISDRDTRFTSRFWQELHKLLDVKLALSTAYHPQTEGQTEVTNKTLKTMLRAFVDNKQSNWDQLLPSLEFAYNNAVNASTGYSPFFLSTGQHPRLPTALLSVPSSPVPTVDSVLTEEATTPILAQDALQRAQDHQEEQANKRRCNDKFKVGDKVLLSATNIMIPADSTDQPTNCDHSTLGHSHCWNNTHQSPSALSYLPFTRSTTSFPRISRASNSRV